MNNQDPSVRKGPIILAQDIDRVITYNMQEFDITYIEAIGVLQMMVMDLNQEAREILQEIQDAKDEEEAEKEDEEEEDNDCED